MNRLRRAIGALAAAAALALVASPASAADGTIAHVEGSEEGLQILVSVPPDADIDFEGVEVTVDGAAAEADAVLADTDTRIRRTTILAIDTSKSMAGARFDAAKAAALAFIDAVPDDVFIGIVSFDSQVTKALAPTTDRDQARFGRRVPGAEPQHPAVRRRAGRPGPGRDRSVSARCWSCRTARTPARPRSERSPRRSRRATPPSTWWPSSSRPTSSVRCSDWPTRAAAR